jgi:hypothetical protein
MTLVPGVDLYVRVNDPHGKQTSSLGKVPGAALMLAVRSPNRRMFPIPMTARDRAGFDYHLSVPAETDLVFTAFSDAISIADDLGQPISKQTGRSVKIHIPPGQAQHREVINIQ